MELLSAQPPSSTQRCRVRFLTPRAGTECTMVCYSSVCAAPRRRRGCLWLAAARWSNSSEFARRPSRNSEGVFGKSLPFVEFAHHVRIHLSHFPERLGKKFWGGEMELLSAQPPSSLQRCRVRFLTPRAATVSAMV